MIEYNSIISYVVDAIERAFPGRKIGNRSIAILTGAQKTIGEFLSTEASPTTSPTVYVSFNGYTFPDPRENNAGQKSREYAIMISAGIPAASAPSRSRTLSEPVSDAERIADAIADVINSDEGFRLSGQTQYVKAQIVGGRPLFLTLGVDVLSLDLVIF